MRRKIFVLVALSFAVTIGSSFMQKAKAAQPQTESERREMIHRVLFAIYDKQGRTEEAGQELAALTELKPNDPSFPLNAGALLIKQKKYDAAMVKFDDAIKADPNLAEGYAMKGQCYAAQKKYKEAVDMYTKANQHIKSGQSFNAQISVNQQMLDKQIQEKQYLDAISGKGKSKGKG